jgi:AcrR family transcriptional regulator
MNTPTPPNARTKETREQLLRAATSAFALHGFHATSLKTIAEQAQINQALIAYHFGGKDGLYLAVFEAIVQQLQARIGERVEAIASLLTCTACPGRTGARGLAARGLRAVRCHDRAVHQRTEPRLGPADLA